MVLAVRKAEAEHVTAPVQRLGRSAAPEREAAIVAIGKPGTRASRSRTWARIRMLLIWASIIAALAGGWAIRDLELVTAETRLGYWLGVAGGSLMLLLLLYPLRKHYARMRWMGPTRYWFKLHMTFGLLGPLLILYHCNFSFGSTNSNVALVCMLTVATSGLVGRYIYAKIHHGLYGSKATLQDLRDELAALPSEDAAALLPDLFRRLHDLDMAALTVSTSFWGGAARALTWPVRRWILQFSLMWSVRHELDGRMPWTAGLEGLRPRIERDAKRFIREHLAGIRKVAEFSFYERLFALWHVFHLPMFLLMVVAAVVHVLYVHMY